MLNGFFVPRSNSITMSVLFDSIDWWRVSLHFYERAIVIPHPPCSYSRIWGQAISRNQTHIDSHSLATHARFAYYIRATYVSIFVHVRACVYARALFRLPIGIQIDCTANYTRLVSLQLLLSVLSVNLDRSSN